MKKQFKAEFGVQSAKEALERKFRQLDRNSDNKLTKSELKVVFDLRKLESFSKRRTRVCIRSILSRCDNANGRADRKLGLTEWTKCFNERISIADRLPCKGPMCFLNPEPSSEPSRDEVETEENEGKHDGNVPTRKTKPKENNCRKEKMYISDCHRSKGRSRRFASTLPLSWGESPSVSPNQNSNCPAIPSCSQSDPRRWKRIQCDTESTLCWCVNPATGDYDYNFRVKTGKDKNSKLKRRLCARLLAKLHLQHQSAVVGANVRVFERASRRSSVNHRRKRALYRRRKASRVIVGGVVLWSVRHDWLEAKSATEQN